MAIPAEMKKPIAAPATSLAILKLGTRSSMERSWSVWSAHGVAHPAQAAPFESASGPAVSSRGHVFATTLVTQNVRSMLA
jgi:hypothetical protein